MKRETDTTHNRTYDPSLLIKTEKVKAVLQRFRYDIPALLGENLAFGCVVGGFAKGYAVADQDVDMFVCVHRYDPQLEKAYRKYYFDLHSEFDLVPDHGKPGEFMTLGRLHQKLALVQNRSLRKSIETYYEFEALLWFEMLTGPKAAMVGNLSLFNSVLESCETLPQKWRHELFQLIGDELDPELMKLSTHRLMKEARRRKFMKYHKLDKKENHVSSTYKTYSSADLDDHGTLLS